MKRFAQLFKQVDSTNRSGDKLAALEAYFRETPPRDAAWALHVLYGRRLVRGLSGSRLRGWLAQATQLPGWLIEESYEAVGDMSETISLLLSADRPPGEEPLHQVIEQRLLPLEKMNQDQQRDVIMQAWSDFDRTQVFLFHKLLSQSFRIGLARKSVILAMARAAGVDPAIMAHRLTGPWKPTAEDYLQLLSPHPGTGPSSGQPYPFYLASPLEARPASLGEVGDWRFEWKWDGIRAQMLRHPGAIMLWSRGEELINESFPELVAVAESLPSGTVLDGEILAWEDDRPLSFHLLQRRLQRRLATARLFADVPVVFMAYDLLEQDGQDLRSRPLHERQDRLEALVAAIGESALRLSPWVPMASWEELTSMLRQARARGVEGIMIKRVDSPYRTGRVRGDWWKLKVEPFTVDAVMLYAQRGSGKRASLFTDYTFGVWAYGPDGEGHLVPVAKAYSGLDDGEIRAVDRWIRSHTTGRSGPVRFVEPVQVFELAFEGITRSNRHLAGIALRFPRIARWRRDKSASEADTLATLEKLLSARGGGDG